MFLCFQTQKLIPRINSVYSIHLRMHLFKYSIVRNGFSMNFSIHGSNAWWSCARMVRMTALDIQVSLRNDTAMLEDSMMSVKTLYSDNALLSLNWWYYHVYTVLLLVEWAPQEQASRGLRGPSWCACHPRSSGQHGRLQAEDGQGLRRPRTPPHERSQETQPATHPGRTGECKHVIE